MNKGTKIAIGLFAGSVILTIVFWLIGLPFFFLFLFLPLFLFFPRRERRICPVCGVEVFDDSNYCRVCGAELKK